MGQRRKGRYQMNQRLVGVFNWNKRYGRIPTLILLFAALAVGLAVLLVGNTAASPSTLFVNTNDDLDDGTCDAAHCSLREAINSANTLPGLETIEFIIPATETIFLTPNTQLPIINDNLMMNGNGQTVAAVADHWDTRVFEIETGSAVTITHMTIRDGRLQGRPGAAFFNRGRLTLIESTVRDNYVASYGGTGGGIYNNQGLVTLIRSAVIVNYSDFDAAGIGNYGGTVIIDNSTVSKNTTYEGISGVINRQNSTLIIRNSTMGENWGFTQSSDLYNFGEVYMVNSILASGCKNEGEILQNDSNLIVNGLCEADYGGNPMIKLLADNGGPTQTHDLWPGSPAFNNANSTYCPTIDQRGISRPQGAGCEIGSFESKLSPTAVSLTDFGETTKNTYRFWVASLMAVLLAVLVRFAIRRFTFAKFSE